MIFMLIPMFADMIDSLEKLFAVHFTGIVMEMMMRIMEEKESVITVQGIIVMSAEAALTALIFIWLYKRNGFERE